jgi:maltooligosyltrehalose synthase
LWPQEWLDFMLRWQMFTGSAMAKGFEDTAFYTHTALLSINEVGADRFGVIGVSALKPFTSSTASGGNTGRAQ